MASTYSSSLNLEIQTTGENSGTWGTIVNNNLQKLESAIKGYVSIAVASTSDSLDVDNGTTGDEQSNAIIKLTGTLTGNTTMQCEAVESWYIVDNATSMGTYTLGFKPAGGTAASLVSSSKHILYSDGSTMFDVLADCGNITANGTLAVAGNVSLDGGGFVFNETGASVDLRMETNTLANAFFVDGSADKIGFGTSSPAGAAVEINQANSSGAIACLALDQDDTDEPFIKFDGDSQTDNSGNIATESDAVGSLTGYIRVDVAGTDRWIPYYATS